MNLEVYAATAVHLSIPLLRSHLTMILDDRLMKDLTTMAIHEFNKYHISKNVIPVLSSPRLISSMLLPLPLNDPTFDAESGIFSHSRVIMLRSLFFSLSLDLISLILSLDLIRHRLSSFLILHPNQTPISYPDLITQPPTCSYHATIHADTSMLSRS